MHDSVERADNVLLNHRSKEESSLKSAGSSALENRTSARDFKSLNSEPGFAKAQIKDVCKRNEREDKD